MQKSVEFLNTIMQIPFFILKTIEVIIDRKNMFAIYSSLRLFAVSFQGKHLMCHWMKIKAGFTSKWSSSFVKFCGIMPTIHTKEFQNVPFPYKATCSDFFMKDSWQ